MEMIDKLQQRLKELEEFSKLAPAPIEIKVNNTVYAVYPPSLWVINTVEKKFAEISVKRIKAAQALNENKQPDFEELTSLFAEHIDIAAEIVQVILDKKPTEKHVVPLDELMYEWSVFDLVKVFKAYDYLVDVSDFFQSFRVPTVKI